MRYLISALAGGFTCCVAVMAFGTPLWVGAVFAFLAGMVVGAVV